MKICPFLVAGQSMLAPEPRPASPDPQSLLLPGRRVLVESDDGKFVQLDTGVEMAKVGTPSEAGLGRSRPSLTAGVDAASTFDVTEFAGRECMGESCRFSQAGGCRFDALFASAAVGSSVAAWLGGVTGTGGAAGTGVMLGTEAGTGVDGSVSPDGPAPVATPPEVASIPFMLEEVWSLQRESLREVIGGFRKLESLQAETRADLASDVRAQAAALNGELRAQAVVLGEVRTLPPHPALVDLLRVRFEALERDVRQIEATFRGALADSGATMRSLLADSQAEVKAAVDDSGAGVRAALADSEAHLEAALTDTEARLHSVVEESRSAVRASAETTQGTVRTALGDAQTQIGSLVSRATAETRAQLERGLTKLLEEVQEVRQVRAQLQSALDVLARETCEVSNIARRIEASQGQTHQILDEQRQQAARADARERRDKARQLNNAGVMSYHQAAYETAVERFKQATELDPALGEAYNNLGLAYTEMGRDDEASAAFQRALEIDPAAGQVYNNLGYLYYRRGDLSHAVDMYQRAIQRGEDTSAAYANLANAYYKMKRFDEAVAAWRRALEIDPSNQRAASALERLGLEVRPV